MGKHAARSPEGGAPSGASNVPEFPGTPPSTQAGKFWSGLRETAVLLVLALGLAVVLRTFVVQAFFVPSESMVPALLKDDRIVVSSCPPTSGEWTAERSWSFATPAIGSTPPRAL